jgi:hypothetical protein
VPGTVVVGTQWGDEGKGKLTDLLAGQMDMVVRYHEVDGKRLDHMPYHQSVLHKVKPVYEELPGWQTDCSGATTLEQDRSGYRESASPEPRGLRSIVLHRQVHDVDDHVDGFPRRRTRRRAPPGVPSATHRLLGRMTRPSPEAEVAAMLRRVIDAVHRGELEAEGREALGLLRRMEGAAAALEASSANHKR